MITRIKDIIAHYNLSIRGFAIKIGVNQPTLDRMLKGINALNLNCIIGILSAYPDISAEWLLRGEGPMLHSSIPPKEETEKMARLVDTITMLQAAINEKSKTIQALEQEIQKLKK